MYANINTNPLYFKEQGSRESMPVIFLHGFPFSHEMWKSQLELVGKDFRAIAYDLRGHGKSYVGEAQFTIEHHVDDLIGMLDYLEIPKVVIVGLSMGGYITLRALERNLDRFRAAVLCDTKSEGDTNEGKLKRFDGMKSVHANGSEAFAEGFTKAVFTAESFSTRPEGVALIKKTIASTPALSIAGTLLALAARTDTTPSLPSIKIPTLILVGEKDVITPPANSQLMHEKIAGSELHIIPAAAHMSNIENSSVFNQHLLTFLRRVASA